jgi:hypothetical protein
MQLETLRIFAALKKIAEKRYRCSVAALPHIGWATDFLGLLKHLAKSGANRGSSVKFFPVPIFPINVNQDVSPAATKTKTLFPKEPSRFARFVQQEPTSGEVREVVLRE